MNKILSSFEKIGYRLMHTLLLAAIFLFCCGQVAGIRSLSGWHFVAAILTIVLFIVFWRLKGKWRLLGALLIIAVLSCLILTIGPQNVFSFLQSYIHWLTGAGAWQSDWILGYEILQTVFFVFIICFLVIFLENYEKLRLGFASFMLLGLLVALFTKITLSHEGVVCILFYLILVCMEWIQITWKKHRNKDYKAHTLWIMPFLVSYFLLMLFMPSPAKPYDWAFVKAAYQKIESTFSHLTDFMWGDGRDELGPALSGFTEDGTLRDGISAGTKEIMKIKSHISLVTNIYLSGKTFDTFDGLQWIQTDKATTIYEDTIKTVQAAENYGNTFLRNYLSKTTIEVSYLHFNSSTLFLPLKTEEYKETEEGYEATYYQLNADSALFYEMLNQAQTATPTEDFAAHELYAQEVILSKETQAYLDEITKDAQNDIEKLRLIEKELSSFTYNSTPGPLPDWVTDESSFLDYFLLESKQGFCTHFATAFVLLARAEGIPARYVQGFCIPANGEGAYTVYSNMAHAWPEVYISGVGFIPFEPTPGYANIRYTPWAIVTNSADSSGTGSHYQSGGYIPEMENTEAVTPLEEETTPAFTLLKGFAYTLLTIFVFLLVVETVYKLRERRRYRKMSLAEKFQMEVSVNLRLFATLGAQRGSNETLQEFSVRIRQLPDYQEEMGPFIAPYEDFLYGKKEVSTEMLKIVKQSQKLLFKSIKRKSTVLYFFHWLHFYPYSSL